MRPEWIEHDGKGPPDLPPGTEVLVRMRNGMGESWGPSPFEYWIADEDDPAEYWLFSDSPWDIVAYKALANG